jgi:EAL and modified HD-GYP domain-containing signal transduction protein
MVSVACMSDGKPKELVMLPLIRARFCELLAPLARCPAAASDLFLLGLLSAMDAILDMEIGDVLKEINVREERRDAPSENRIAWAMCSSWHSTTRKDVGIW